MKAFRNRITFYTPISISINVPPPFRILISETRLLLVVASFIEIYCSLRVRFPLNSEYLLKKLNAILPFFFNLLCKKCPCSLYSKEVPFCRYKYGMIVLTKITYWTLSLFETYRVHLLNQSNPDCIQGNMMHRLID